MLLNTAKYVITKPMMLISAMSIMTTSTIIATATSKGNATGDISNRGNSNISIINNKDYNKNNSKYTK